jgi:phosphonate transport system permease protein
MRVAAAPVHARRWSPPPLIRNPFLRWGLVLGAVAYLVVATMTVEVNWQRVALGIERSSRLLSGFLRPDFVTRGPQILGGLLESMAMAVTSTIIGGALCIPFGLGAARNISTPVVYFVCRLVIVLARSFQEVIIAIFFVVMVGFGPFAGMLTLSLATIGFLAKLLAEEIESTDATQIEAMRATGASWLQVVAYGVVPQVLPRFIGLTVYRLDQNFRNSAVIGIVGAGGIGAVLNTAMSRYDYDVAGAILLSIVALVLAAEYISGIIRARLR